MAALTPTDPDFLALLKALGMPDGCRRFVLVAEVNAAVLVEMTVYAERTTNWKGAAAAAEAVTRKYRLVPIEEADK